MTGANSWLRYPWLWGSGLGVLLLALGSLLFYRGVLADEAELGKVRITRADERVQDLRAERERLERFVDAAAGTEEGLDEFYGVRLAREERALTRMIAETKELSTRAGLEPGDINYEKEPFEDEDLLRWSMVFGVDGTYQELRRLVNFLELTDSFLILEKVELRGEEDGSPNLRIDLGIATLFSTTEGRVADSEAVGQGE